MCPPPSPTTVLTAKKISTVLLHFKENFYEIVSGWNLPILGCSGAGIENDESVFFKDETLNLNLSPPPSSKIF